MGIFILYKSIDVFDMKLSILCLLFSTSSVLLSCVKKESKMSKANIIGGWRRVTPAPKKNRFGGFNPRWMDNWLGIREVNNQLFLSSYQGHHNLKLNASGDTLTLRQGCISFETPASLSQGHGVVSDTLWILPYGKYVRMNLSDFDTGRKAFIDSIKLKRAKRNL